MTAHDREQGGVIPRFVVAGIDRRGSVEREAQAPESAMRQVERSAATWTP